jgi:hypothetical protein
MVCLPSWSTFEISAAHYVGKSESYSIRLVFCKHGLTGIPGEWWVSFIQHKPGTRGRNSGCWATNLLVTRARFRNLSSTFRYNDYGFNNLSVHFFDSRAISIRYYRGDNRLARLINSRATLAHIEPPRRTWPNPQAYFTGVPFDIRADIYEYILYNPLLAQSLSISKYNGYGAAMQYDLSPQLLVLSRDINKETHKFFLRKKYILHGFST